MPRNNKPPKKRLAPEGGWSKSEKSTPPATNLSVAKKPSVLRLSDYEVPKRNLAWRLSWIDKDGQWSPSNIDGKTMAVIVAKLISFESMTVGEIFKPGSEHGKSYDVSKLPEPAASRIKAIKRDDEDCVHRLRFTGKQRLYGIMRENVFNVLWWDPEHEVWPSSKK
ncbi:hypothetical protein ACTXM3_11930 [Glutamicibacter arilaitensis]|uniref:hypothetical protein n=1 Tax=Glutamicibacter arilaitensis TaxID=256701 RepID=UPI003FD44CFE